MKFELSERRLTREEVMALQAMFAEGGNLAERVKFLRHCELREPYGAGHAENMESEVDALQRAVRSILAERN
jgi:hypothetical protein